MWIFPLLFACVRPSSTEAPVLDTGADTAVPTAIEPEGLLDSLLAGEVDPISATRDLAWESGWPVQQGDLYSFVILDGGPWALVGDFNNWEPTPMNCDPGLCWVQIVIEGDVDGLKYKFTRDGEFIADPNARSYRYDEFGELSYVRPPLGEWRLDRWPGVSTDGLLDRDLRVYVPPGPGPFPVLYAHDGQNLFDPAAMWGGWRLQDSLATRPALVVGIDNTAERFGDYTPVEDDIGDGPVGGNGDAYADLVHAVVRPHIESVYGSTGVDGQLGSSLGGLIALHIAQRYPGEYDFVASLSGTLGWGRIGDLGEPMEASWLAADPGGVLFVSSGGGPGADGLCTDPDGDGYPEDDPDAQDNYCENRQFVDVLAAAGRTWDADLYHWYEAGAEHNEAAWAAVVDRPLDIFVGL